MSSSSLPQKISNYDSIDPQAEFLQGLIELQYGYDVKIKLQHLAPKIPWAIGWPENNIAFWNAEAFMWTHKIDKEIRKVISQELAPLSTGRNLDLGCGAYSYVPSVGFDISPKMLNCNDQCVEKITGDLEKPLPLESHSYESITTIFVLNYIQHLHQLLTEIKRILKPNGTFAVVLSVNPINDWQRQKEINSYKSTEWCSFLEQYFSVTVKEVSGLLILWCQA